MEALVKTELEAGKTLNDLFEEEVITSSRPKKIKFITVDGQSISITVRPLCMDDLSKATEFATTIANKIITVIVSAQIAVAMAARSAENKEEVGKVPLELEKDYISKDNITPLVLQSIEAMKWLIQCGSDAKWEVVSKDYMALVELVIVILEHNTGERLLRFLTSGLTRLTNSLGLKTQGPTSANLDLKPSSLKPDIQ
jgi:hypothetical protein